LKDNNCFVKSEEEHLAVFAHRFLRSYRLLHFIACRILGDEVRAPIAIQNCWRTASHNPPRFDYEGAFRSWLARVLIDEALAMRRESQEERDAAAAVVDVVSMANNTLKTRA
jgi:DNA-directed RNA polymerase specialized sigma24 family protein